MSKIEMDTRVGFGTISVLAGILEEAIRSCVDNIGYIGDPDVILKYLELREYLEKGERK